MGRSDPSPGDGFESNGSGIGIKIGTEVLVAAVIFLFLIVVFLCFVYLYMKKYWASRSLSRRRSQLIFASTDPLIPSRGLDASVILSLPATVYKRADFKDGLECSVCLCELSDGEEARLLPKCSHGFHLQCIDMWFHSHSTCPLCRCPVGSAEASLPIPQPESPVFPTNVLFWGNQDHVSSRSSPNSSRTLRISLPNRTGEGFPSPMSPLPQSRFPLEGLKSPSEGGSGSPGASKLRSLRRLWSRGKKTGCSSCSSPMGGDVEQGLAIGEGSSIVPKTPTTS